MDPKPPEQKPSEQQEIKEGILLDKATARALGRGLRQQIFTDDRLNNIHSSTEALSRINGINSEWTNSMSSYMGNIRNFIYNMETAKQVRLVIKKGNLSESDNRNWEFDFSDEKEPKEIPQESKILIDAMLGQKLISALSHHLGSYLVPIPGFAELIQIRTDDDNAKKSAGKIMEVYRDIEPLFEALRQRQGEMVLDTNGEGNTSIA